MIIIALDFGTWLLFFFHLWWLDFFFFHRLWLGLLWLFLRLLHFFRLVHGILKEDSLLIVALKTQIIDTLFTMPRSNFVCIKPLTYITASVLWFRRSRRIFQNMSFFTSHLFAFFVVAVLAEVIWTFLAIVGTDFLGIYVVT